MPTPALPLVYLACAAILLALDMVWLTSMKGFYKSELGDLMRDSPRMLAAIAFYLIYAAGIAIFAVRPNLQADSVWPVLGAGALLGLVAYGTYDMTNYATLRGFPLKLALVDWAWGIVVTSVSATAAWGVLRWMVAR